MIILSEISLLRYSSLFGEELGLIQLRLANVDPNDICPPVLCEPRRESADTTSTVEDAISLILTDINT